MRSEMRLGLQSVDARPVAGISVSFTMRLFLVELLRPDFERQSALRPTLGNASAMDSSNNAHIRARTFTYVSSSAAHRWATSSSP